MLQWFGYNIFSLGLDQIILIQSFGTETLVDCFQDPKATPPPTRAETRDERRERKRREKAEQVAYKLEQEIAMCKLTQPLPVN